MAYCVSESKADGAEQEEAGTEPQHRSKAQGKFSVIAGCGFKFFPAKVSDHSLPPVD